MFCQLPVVMQDCVTDCGDSFKEVNRTHFSIGGRKVLQQNVKELTPKALSNWKINNWRNALEHVKKIEKEFWRIYFRDSSPIVENFKINLTDPDNEVLNKEVGSSESSDEIQKTIFKHI